ncbi:adenosylcobinamide-phosphate synthase CbiB [Bacillus sp. DTU_2020_1000418_1_SI_GHA_SEK_038]|uniref:adenosylcobinamide-phosphate synthase CbiB n=1 Tax=Bacillus sp. DTU_2020_1000418_1_SI_GHA_SEK_038 TaxID=3077585 RepID=UPI0028E22B74|nr:adenosylcobinamide-phosphate synthase CbiB [Bacillus sp. DTU_2020_1000418_1_SI_GHA_SEK_038]WNS77513.1 adenosylcobinamide-phosphate synthase CbiB [Bacillus sp. DTU_2020_1000418_1_SI_GHA_SEK_038]
MILYHLIALTIAVLIDLVVGDPPHFPHPVKWMGSFIYKLDKSWNKGSSRRLKGAAMLLTVLLTVAGITLLLVYILYGIHPIAGILAEAILISTAIAQKSLKEAAMTVYEPLIKGDIVEARHKLSYIVGRDTDKLNEPEIVRATVETVAENTSDGITAPLFWALIGGAPFALVYRAINTCDSMVGYRNEKYEDFGWASARLDDVVNWIPSRLTSVCMLAGNRPAHTKMKKVREIVFRDAKKHPSPNSGWGEAAVAGLLGIQLGGINYYKGNVSNRATMGDPLYSLEKVHILKTNNIVTRTVPIFLILLWIGGMLIELARTWF